MNTCIIVKMYCKHHRQIQDLQCLPSAHAARPQRSHGTLEDPTALPQRPQMFYILEVYCGKSLVA